MLNSFAISAGKGKLRMKLPSTEQEAKRLRICLYLTERDRVVLEVDMDARPRTAVFIINGNAPLTFVSEKGEDNKRRAKPSTVLLSEPITTGVVSVTFVVLTLAESLEQEGFFNFGLLDSSMAVPQLGQVLGKDVKNSFGLSTSSGNLLLFNQILLEAECHFNVSKKARIVMEVNMDSTPRTVQFFVNGKALERYVSEIPESVRFGVCALFVSILTRSVLC
ncbi:hypothetical protein BLNAU_10190 [Blattamonas nauphoetae]|uniref:Uncharacterized protein n=1 Tax=Blattamonas nauphoetae TaxID=2049346 RepID=A0ABQ9XTQ0_9EUKA|nr:hypothetical protein BLNAU_10190 [Blattamonas nauphoetae]